MNAIKEKNIVDENNFRREIFSRTRRVIKVVCRDSINLLDPPNNNNSNINFNNKSSNNNRNSNYFSTNRFMKVFNEDDTRLNNNNINYDNDYNVTFSNIIKNNNENIGDEEDKKDKKQNKKDKNEDNNDNNCTKNEQNLHLPYLSHPALLTPLLATQDCSLRILNILSALLNTAGCALLLKGNLNQTVHSLPNKIAVSTDTVYQGICTGTALSWFDLPNDLFGNIVIPGQESIKLSDPRSHQRPDPRSHPRSHPRSLVESCMISGQTLTLEDGTSDPRYCYITDGNILSESPYMITPIRGREGTIVGVLLAVRKRGGNFYSQVNNGKNRNKSSE